MRRRATTSSGRPGSWMRSDAGAQLGDEGLADVDADDRMAELRQAGGQDQADVAAADDGDPSRLARRWRRRVGTSPARASSSVMRSILGRPIN